MWNFIGIKKQFNGSAVIRVQDSIEDRSLEKLEIDELNERLLRANEKLMKTFEEVMKNM